METRESHKIEITVTYHSVAISDKFSQLTGIENRVTVDGEPFYHNWEKAPLCHKSTHPLHCLERWLANEKPQCGCDVCENGSQDISNQVYS